MGSAYHFLQTFISGPVLSAGKLAWIVLERTGQNEKKIAHSFVPSEGFASSHSLFGGTAKIAKRLSHNQHLWRVRWNRHLKSDPGPIDDSGEGGWSRNQRQGSVGTKNRRAAAAALIKL